MSVWFLEYTEFQMTRNCELQYLISLKASFMDVDWRIFIQVSNIVVKREDAKTFNTTISMSDSIQYFAYMLIRQGHGCIFLNNYVAWSCVFVPKQQCDPCLLVGIHPSVSLWDRTSFSFVIWRNHGCCSVKHGNISGSNIQRHEAMDAPRNHSWVTTIYGQWQHSDEANGGCAQWLQSFYFLSHPKKLKHHCCAIEILLSHMHKCRRSLIENMMDAILNIYRGFLEKNWW